MGREAIVLDDVTVDEEEISGVPELHFLLVHSAALAEAPARTPKTKAAAYYAAHGPNETKLSCGHWRQG